jgi:MFS family permease
MVQQMQASTPLMVGLLSSTVGIGFLLGVLILPRIKPLFESDMMSLGVVTTGLLISATIFLMVSLPAIHLVLFTTTAFFAGGILPIFWSIAMKRLQGIQAAAGLAFINTIGLMGGFVGPYIFGLVERETGRSASGFVVIAVTAALGLVLIPALAKTLRTESRPQDDGLLVPSHT